MRIKSKNRQSFEAEISKEQLINDLRKIGLKEGDHIAVSLSFKSIGYVRGGPNGFIEALLEVIGPDGTIMMNTFTRQFHLSKIAAGKVDYIFDYRKTSTWAGIIPETLRNRKSSIRSRHPTCSVVAIGKLAKYLTEDHDENAGSYLPYSKLAEVGGKVLCIGIGERIVAIRHEVQYQAGLLKIIPPRYGVKFRDDNGRIRLFVRRDDGGCTKRLPEFTQILRKKKLVEEGRIGEAKSILISAKNMIEIMSEVLKKNPEINLCGRIRCLWCRELERRLDLYNRLEKPKIFQRNSLVIKIIALINWFRLKNYLADEINKFIDEVFKIIFSILIEKRNIEIELIHGLSKFKSKLVKTRD